MKTQEIIKLRLINQLLLTSTLQAPQEVVSWMGAMQAQDFNMAKWGIGNRIYGIKDSAIEDSFNKGEVLRTHILRPTWHFVSSEDIHWMLNLSHKQNKSAMRASDKVLGLLPDVIMQTNNIIAKTLDKGIHLTRQEIGFALQDNGIDCGDSRRLNHIMMNAEMDGIICSGVLKNKQQTYALLEERTTQKILLNEEESLARLASKYFTSHGPATLQDFMWWSALPVRKAKLAIYLIENDLLRIEMDSKDYWFKDNTSSEANLKEIIHLLPAFDEYFVGYQSRHHIVADEHYPKVATKNGLFKPMLLKEGEIIGKWKRISEQNKISAETEIFISLNKKSLQNLQLATENYTLYHTN